MFSENKKAKGATIATNQQNRIAQGTKIIGDIVSEGGFRIDGEVEGNIQTKGKVVIGVQGKIKGTLVCENADIEGQFSGKLQVGEVLSLKATSQVQGDVETGRLHVEPEAIFNATCVMKGAIKELKGASSGKKSKEKTA